MCSTRHSFVTADVIQLEPAEWEGPHLVRVVQSYDFQSCDHGGSCTCTVGGLSWTNLLLVGQWLLRGMRSGPGSCDRARSWASRRCTQPLSCIATSRTS